jgi:hypothetical protein
MYQLTINSARSGTAVTGHSNRPAACDALHRHAVATDVYLHAVEAADPRSSYHLVELADRPRTAGHATIEPMSAAAETLYHHAGEAHRWIGAHSTQPAGQPARVLARARGAATNPAQASILWVEAAALAGVEPVPDVDPVTLHDLAHLISTGSAPMSTAQLAIMVAAAETGPDVGAVLTWWVTLRTWAGLPS